MIKLKRNLVVAVAFILVSVASANELENFIDNLDLTNFENENLVSIDRIIDNNLERIRDLLSNVDPTKLMDVNLLGKGHLTEGQLNQLSTLSRTGKCSLAYKKKVMTATLYLGWDALSFDYKYDLKLWFIQRNGKLTGTLPKISIKLILDVDFNTYKVVFKQLKFENVGKMKIKLEGTLGDKVRTWLGNLVLNLGKKQIIQKVEAEASKIFAEKVDELNKLLPVPNHFHYIDLVRTEDNLYY